MTHRLEERFILTEDTSETTAANETTNTSNTVNNAPVLSTVTNWGQKYKNCTSPADQAKFWEAYLSYLCGADQNNEEGTKNVPTAQGKALIPILAGWLPKADEGWQKETNPVILLISQIATGKFNSIALKALTPSTVQTLINELNNGIITEDIVNTTISASNTGTIVLLNSPSFYTLDAATQKKFLRLQKSFEIKTGEALWPKPFNQCCVAGNKLVSIEQAQVNAKKLGVKPEDKNISAETVNKFANKIEKLPIEEVKITYACLYDAFAILLPECLAQVKNKCQNADATEAKRKEVTSLSFEQISSIRNQFLPAGKKYDVKSATMLLLALLKRLEVPLKEET